MRVAMLSLQGRLISSYCLDVKGRRNANKTKCCIHSADVLRYLRHKSVSRQVAFDAVPLDPRLSSSSGVK